MLFLVKLERGYEGEGDQDTEIIIENIRHVLKEKFNIDHVTVQFECKTCTEPDIETESKKAD